MINLFKCPYIKVGECVCYCKVRNCEICFDYRNHEECSFYIKEIKGLRKGSPSAHLVG